MSVPTRRSFGVLAGLLGLMLAGAAQAQSPAPAGGTGPLLFAAASLKNATDEISAAWAATGKPAPRVSLAASNALAKQIEQGAPADLFFSADTDWMDYLAKVNLVRPDSRVDLLANSIVLIAPKASSAAVALEPGLDLAAALGPDGRLAMGNVDAVPAGKYGRAALDSLGAWDGVKARVAQADSVRAALALVSRGEAPLGIVYATDAAADPAVRVVAVFPARSHPPIVYPVALTRDATSPEAGAFLLFLRGPAARAAFERQGFTVLNKAASGS